MTTTVRLEAQRQRGKMNVDVTLEFGRPAEAMVDALILPVGSGSDAPAWSPLAKELDAALSGELSALAADARFSGKAAATFVVPSLGRIPSRRIIFAGLGSVENLGEATVTRMAGAAVRAARDAGARRIAIALPDAEIGIGPDEALQAAAIGVSLGLYRFDDYRGEDAPDSAKGPDVESVRFVGMEHPGAGSERALRRAAAVARGVNLARDLSNEPASTLTPEVFARHAQAIAQESNLKIEVLGPAELTAIGAAATLV